MRTVLTIIICVIIAGLGVLGVWLINATEPEAQQKAAVSESAMLVETQPVEFGTFRPSIRAMGTVEAARRVMLTSRVPGHVIEIADAFEPGSVLEQGDTLVRLDPTDFRNIIAERRGALAEARAEVRIEEGLQEVARSDLELIDSVGLSGERADTDLSADDRDLVLREPQRMAAQARVDAAAAQLEQARLNLSRTRIEAPFDAQVLSREVDVGSQIESGAALGTLVGTDTYWVIASVPQSRLRWLGLPGAPMLADEDEEGELRDSLPAQVRDRVSWPEGVTREARLLRIIGSLEEDTRMARVLVEVSDPLARLESNQGQPALLIGAFVQVEVPARPLENVAKVPRDLVRDGDTVWVMADGKLQIRDVTIEFSDATHSYISDGLTGSERLVVTNLATISEGAPLREEGEGTGTESEPTDDEQRDSPEEETGE